MPWGGQPLSSTTSSSQNSCRYRTVINAVQIIVMLFFIVSLVCQEFFGDMKLNDISAAASYGLRHDGRSVSMTGASDEMGSLENQHASTNDESTEGVVSEDLCSVDYWISQLSMERYPTETLRTSTAVPSSNEMDTDWLSDLDESDIGVIHISFSVGGSTNRKANDRINGTHNRDMETDYSVSCLKKTMPTINYKPVHLGDYPSYQLALSAQHEWLSRQPPFAGTFVIDTDVYANPQSAVTPFLMARALKNVDLALVYSPERMAPTKEDNNRVNLQLSGLQAGLMGQRNNRRTQLFNACVSDILKKHTQGSIRQQYAINQVLESPLAQFLRIRWLPPEYHCWSPHLTTLENFTISQGPFVQEDPCYFVHSHNLARKGGLEGKCGL